jgi:hypothetical protein
MTRPSRIVPIVVVLALAAIAISGAAVAQPRERASRDLQPDLSLSIGLGCIVYLRTPPEGPGASTMVANGLNRDRNRPVTIEGTLTGVSSSAITIRNDDRVYWVNVESVSVVEFQTK